MSAGIPARNRTIVVVPAIVDGLARLDALVDDLEVRFLASAMPTCTLRC
jgi:hypothetical protein